MVSTSTTTYNGMAGREDVTLDNAALFLGPRLSVWVGCAGAGEAVSIGAARWILPAVPKHQWVDHHSMGPCGEVIICIVIIVATQPTHTTLKKKSSLHYVGQLQYQNKYCLLLSEQNNCSHLLSHIPVLPYILGWAWGTRWSSCPTWKWVHCWLQWRGRCPWCCNWMELFLHFHLKAAGSFPLLESVLQSKQINKNVLLVNFIHALLISLISTSQETLVVFWNILYWLFTPRKILILLEQVVPVVPQGTFSVSTLKVPLLWALPQ